MPFEGQLVFTEYLKHLFDMLQMLCQELLKTRISSKNTRTNFRMKDLRIPFIKNWNVDDALVRPKGITRNSKCPRCILNAVLSMLSGCMRT
jgi:hypothetical protein